MPTKMTRMFIAERAGMLAVILIILFIAAVTMCGRMGNSPAGGPVPDSALVVQADSALRADSAARDTASVTAAKRPKARTKKKKAEKSQRIPYRRNHRQERVDSAVRH